MGVTLQAVAWDMEPFAVAKKSYVVNDNLAYESQLIHAVIEARAPLRKRLRCTYSGEGADRQCTVSGTFVGEDEPHEYTTPKFKDIPVRNSPLWKWDVDQQLFYLGSRAWAREWCPDVLLGVYSPDEAQYAGETAAPAPVRTVIHNPLEDEAEQGCGIERRYVREASPSGGAMLDGDEAARTLTDEIPEVSEEERVKAAEYFDALSPDDASIKLAPLPDHDPETGEVFDAKTPPERGKAFAAALGADGNLKIVEVDHAPTRAIVGDPGQRGAEDHTGAVNDMVGAAAVPTGMQPSEPPKDAAKAAPRARPRPTPRQAHAEPTGEPKAAAAPKQPVADKTSPGANAALGIAFPQPWIRKTAAEYKAYLQEWVVAWLAYGKDPDGLRNRYSAERTIRSGLGEPADHDTLTKWKGIAADVFKKLGGQS